MQTLPRLFVLVDGHDMPVIPKGATSHYFDNKMSGKRSRQALEEKGHTVFLRYGPDHHKSNGGKRVVP